MSDHLELIYYFSAFAPGVTLNVYLVMTYLKYKNAYTGHFALAYLGTSLLMLCYLINNFLSSISINDYFDYIAFGEVFLMSIIIWFAGMLVLKIFYNRIALLHRTLIFIISSAPFAMYCLWFFGIWSVPHINDIYFLYFLVILIIICILFLLKYKRINEKAFKKMGLIIVCALSFFLVFFIMQVFIPGFNFDTFPIFYLLITVYLIFFGWKYFIKGNIEKVLDMKESFLKKYNITKREQEIIELIQEGRTNRYISKKLFLSEKTVANHIYNIFKKLNINSRFELICLFKE